MFEKEAEEYAENREVCGLLDAISEDLQNYDYGTVAHYNIDPLVEECFKDGAEFGYNKANEWHYVKDGDLPKNNIQVLVLLENERLKTSIFMENKFTVWNKDYNAYTKLYNVIAWKEIVLPKEIKENDL